MSQSFTGRPTVQKKNQFYVAQIQVGGSSYIINSFHFKFMFKGKKW
jgi:hypothetical protein